MNPGLWADAIGITHALVVLFVVGGQALILAGWGLAWRWTRNFLFRVAHLAVIGFVVVQQWLGELCPLTVWESALRRKAGAEGYQAGFIADWLDRLLYYSAPSWVFTAVYTLFVAVVVASFVLYKPVRKPRQSGG
ncbi:MAG: DUF2784 domain-containing protein [Rhodospirillales bacterium]|nr:DUF2784 domain-containing protein [Rhodospirillales bacterium]